MLHLVAFRIAGPFLALMSVFLFSVSVGQFAGRFAGGKEEVFFFVENCLSLRTITQPRRRRGKKAGGKGRKESLSFLQVFVFLLWCLGFLSLPPIAFLHAYDKEQECFDLGETAVRYE